MWKETRRLLQEAARAGASHVVFISIVGVDRNPYYPYFRHKLDAEQVVEVLRSAPRPLFNVVMKLGSFFSKTQLIAYEKFFEWQVGADNYADALEKFRSWKVDVEKISCPVLCMMGTGETQTFQKQTHICYAALRSPKVLRVFTEEEGADAHSQANNQRLAHQVVFDYFDETFAQGEANLKLRLAEGA